MTTIKKVFDLARIEVWSDANDISDEVLLDIINENIKEMIELIEAEKYEEFFSVNILNDIIPGQFEYWRLNYIYQWLVRNVRKILRVRFLGENIPREDVLIMDDKAIENLTDPVYGVNGYNLFVFHKHKEVVENGLEVIWLTDIPEIDLNTDINDVFMWRLETPERILKMSLKPFLYERMWQLQASINARNEYLLNMKNYVNRIWRVKEPQERVLPDLSYFS